jgi:hypothetical protein
MQGPLQANQDNKLTPEKPTLMRWVFLCLFITSIMLAEAGGFIFKFPLFQGHASGHSSPTPPRVVNRCYRIEGLIFRGVK